MCERKLNKIQGSILVEKWRKHFLVQQMTAPIIFQGLGDYPTAALTARDGQIATLMIETSGSCSDVSLGLSWT